MKKIVTIMVLTTTLFTSGCATLSSWWNSFTENPAAQIQGFFQQVQTVLTLLEGAWSLVQPFIPASALPSVQKQYALAVSAVGHAEGVLQDAVNAAVAAKTSPMPDFSALITAVTDAINQVIAIVDQYKTGTVTASTTVTIPALEEARTRTATLSSFHVVVQ